MTHPRAGFLLLCLVVLLAGLGAAAPRAHAQELVVSGRVIGPDNAGMPGQRVVLHRVDEAGGSTIAEAVSGEEGRFELRAPAAIDTVGVYFVAARYDEELYIGPPFRPMEDPGLEHVIQVGIPSMSATAMMQDPLGGMGMPQRQSRSRNWLLILIPLVGVAGVIVYALLSRSAIPGERRLLIRVAELDERMETAPEGQRDSLREERGRLMAQLREG
jgi:hypothetical protein